MGILGSFVRRRGRVRLVLVVLVMLVLRDARRRGIYVSRVRSHMLALGRDIRDGAVCHWHGVGDAATTQGTLDGIVAHKGRRLLLGRVRRWRRLMRLGERHLGVGRDLDIIRREETYWKTKSVTKI